MELALVLVLVMYFCLLPSRYAGVRFAPTVRERRIVLATFAISAAVLYTQIVGNSIPKHPTEWLEFLIGTAIFVYVVTFPVRLMLKFQFPTFERVLTTTAVILTLGLIVLAPLLGRS